ncbi:MAG TPA: hypothetical protein VGH76_01720 [Actinomycetospora sp.]|jgi:hypothetical protein|uniref:hypothetical protein n=1 Tax=Actinomycetospora sp. TaxID=1872135 RepID=UPI002F3FA2A3
MDRVGLLHGDEVAPRESHEAGVGHGLGDRPEAAGVDERVEVAGRRASCSGAMAAFAWYIHIDEAMLPVSQ